MATYVDTSPNPQHNMILKLNILTKVLQKGICSVQKQHKYDFVSLLKQESTKELRIATALAKLLRYQEIFRKNSLRSGFSSITHQKPKTEELAFNASYNPSYLELENSLKTERIKQLFHSGPDRYFKLDRCLEISQLYLSKTRGKQLVSAFYCLRSSIALRNSNNCSESVTLETPDFVTKTQDTSSEKIRDSKTDQQLNSVESPKEEKNQLINRSLINKSQSMNTLEDIEHENHERSRSHGGRNQWHRRRRSSEEIFEQFRKNANFPDKGATTISRDPSFTKEGGDHQMLPGGINVPDRDFSISAILDSPRLMKKSPIKESLLKMFSSKRRENFIQNLTPETQREKTPERRYATPTRNKGSELKLRLNKISRLLLSPNALSQRKIEKYLRFEHSLFQISRITLGVRRRNLLQAFELVQFYNPNALLYLDKPYLHLRNVLQVANQLWNKYKAEDFQKWKRSRTLTMQQRFAARLVDGWIRSNFRLTLQASLTAIRLYSVERCGKKAEMSERNQKNVHQLYHWIVSKHHQCNLSLMKEFFDIYRAKQSICKGVIAGIQSMNKIIIRSGFNQLNQVLKKASAVKKLVKVAAAIQKSQIEYSMSQLDSNLIHFQEQVSSHADAAKTIYRLLHQKQKESSFLAFLRLQKHASFGVGQDEEIKAYRRQQAVVHLCRVCKNTILKRMYSAFEGMKFCQTLSYRIQLHTLLKGIFLRRKALVFSELRTYCRLMSQFDEGLDYFRHRLKNQLAESESTRQVNKRAAVKLFMAAVRTAHRETKRWAFRQFPKSSTVVRIVEKQYEQKEVTPQSSEDLVNLTQVQEMQAASTIFYIACGVHKAQILGLKNSGFSEIKAHSVSQYLAEQKTEGMRAMRFEKIISEVIQRKQFSFMHTFFLDAISIQNFEAYDTYQKLMKAQAFLCKNYLKKLQHGFFRWKMEVEISRAEHELIEHIMKPKHIQEDHFIGEIDSILDERESIADKVKLTLSHANSMSPGHHHKQTRVVGKKTTLKLEHNPNEFSSTMTPIARISSHEQGDFADASLADMMNTESPGLRKDAPSSFTGNDATFTKFGSRTENLKASHKRGQSSQ